MSHTLYLRRWLSEHNKARALYASPPLTWDPALEAFAKQVSDKCDWEHTAVNKYGEVSRPYWSLYLRSGYPLSRHMWSTCPSQHLAELCRRLAYSHWCYRVLGLGSWRERIFRSGSYGGLTLHTSVIIRNFWLERESLWTSMVNVIPYVLPFDYRGRMEKNNSFGLCRH